LDKFFFHNYNENLIYKYNLIERYDINSDLATGKFNSDLAKNIRHRVLRFKSKTSDNLNSSVSFLHLKNRLAVVVHINTIPNPQTSYLELNFKDFDIVLNNFNCYLVKKDTNIPKFVKLIKELKVTCKDRMFLIERDHIIFNEHRNSANNYFYVTNCQLSRIRENFNSLESYSININNKKVKYFFNKNEKSMLTEFFNVI
jgi:hypothetical protein